MNQPPSNGRAVSSTPTSRSIDDLNTSSTIELTHYPSPEAKAKQNEANATRDLSKATSDFGAALHVIKSSLGSGILAIPNGFKSGGLIFGIFGSIIVGLICTHCAHLVVKCAQELCYLLKRPSLCYADTVEEAFREGAGKRLKRYSKLARNVLDFFQFLTYYGLNTIYVIIIASSFQEVIEHQINFEMNIRFYILILTLFLVPFGLISHLKYLVPFSALANGLLGIGLTITMYYVLQDLPPMDTRTYIGTPRTIPLFLSLLFLGMEGIGTVMPIENSMRNPHHFLGCPGVLNLSMVFVVILYTVIGFFGYLKYGEECEGSITFNLPHDWLAESVKICIALAIFLTYSLQLTASIEVVWNHTKHRFSPPNEERAYYTIRALLIFGTILIAVALPTLAPVISLVGAIGFATLGVTIPAILETVLFWENGLGAYRWRLWKNIILLLVSIFAMITGSITSVIEIINTYKL